MPRSMTRFGASVGLAMSCVGTATAALGPCSHGSCFTQYQCLLNECNDNFNDDHPDNDDYYDQNAWEQCRGGASAHRAACTNGVDQPVLDIFWAQFINNLESCIDEFGEDGDNPNEVNLEECLEEALEDYKQLIDNWLGDNPNSCGGQAVPQDAGGLMFLGPMESLRSAAIQAGNPEGKFPTPANSTVSVMAGVGSGAVAYDASAIACVKSAIAITIYRTKNGTVVMPVDADLDTSDGTTFNIMLMGGELVDTSAVKLLTVFFDEDDKPVFGEMGLFEIEDSPLTGDWNRDGVVDTDDLVDFLQTHTAAMPRADLNGDETLTTDDTWIFMQGYVN